MTIFSATALPGFARFGGTAAGWVLAVSLGVPLLATGQPSGLPSIPGLPKLGGASPAASAASATAAAPLTDAQERERLTSELAEVRRWSDQLADTGTAAVTPPGITPDEVAQAQRKLGQWSFAIEGQLRAMAGIESTRAELVAVQAVSSAWTRPGDQPPYSILVVDDWARDAEVRRTKIASMQAANAVTERELVRLRESAKLTGGAVRRTEETVRSAGDIEAPAAAWRAQAAKWAASAEGATLAAIGRDRQWTLDKLAVEQAQLALLVRKLDAVAGQVRFSAEDLAQVRRIEQTRQARLEKEAVQAGATVEQRAREFDAAMRALQQLRAGQPAPPRTHWTLAMRAFARRELRWRRLGAMSRSLSNLNSLSVAALEMWAWRFDALNAPSADRRREATAAMRKLLDGIRVWKAFASGRGVRRPVRAGGTGGTAGALGPFRRRHPVRSRH